jgi:hypothetical protein
MPFCAEGGSVLKRTGHHQTFQISPSPYGQKLETGVKYFGNQELSG